MTEQTRAEFAAAQLVGTLRRVDLFSELDDSQLAWLAERGEPVALEPGDRAVTEGDPAEHFFVLLDGELAFTVRSGGHESPFVTLTSGSFFAEYPILVGARYLATGTAVRPCRLLRLTADCFWRMLRTMPATTRHILHASTERESLRHSVLRQQEKLAALGKLAAGLAHELNNPAAAARRAVSDLPARVDSALKLAAGLGREGAAAQVLAHRTGGRSANDDDPLERSDREQRILDWLERHDVHDGWELAGELTAAEVDTHDLDQLAADVRAEALGDAIRFLAARRTLSDLLAEAQEGIRRVSELVATVREYSYMDRAPAQDVDLRDGLEATLSMLGHRLRDGDVAVRRDFDASLPRVAARGAELNQVWTNLLTNALDAVGKGGTVQVRTAREGSCLLVEIADDGPGVPAELQTRVFEPFFTTKPVGQGTGLGLETSRRIVESHGGSLSFQSRPGETRFQVRLPAKPDNDG